MDKFFCQIKFGAFCGRFLYGFVKKTQNPLQILQKTNTFFNKLIKNNMTDFGTVFVFAILAIVVAYFLPKVNCNKNKSNSEEHKLTKLPNVNSEELDHWHRMNRF